MESETLRQQFQALQEQQQKKLLKRKQRQEEKNKKKESNDTDNAQSAGDTLGLSDDLGLKVGYMFKSLAFHTRKQKLLVLDNSTRFKYPRTMWNYPLFPIVLTLQNE